MRDRAPSTDEKVVSLATQRAFKAAGGLEVVAQETGRSTSQLSRLQSLERADIINVRELLIADALAAPSLDGVPPILAAIARVLGCVVIPGAGVVHDGDGVPATIMTLTAELGDVSRAVCEALADDGKWSEREARGVLTQIDDLDTASARLRRQVIGILERLRPVEDGETAAVSIRSGEARA